MKKLVCALLVIVMFSCNVLTVNADKNLNLENYSKAALLINKDTKEVLYSKNADEKKSMASMTKIMTMLLVLEAEKDRKISFNDMLTIGEEAANTGGSSMYLEENEIVSVDRLLEGLMVVSANDASVELAKYISKDVNLFVEKMNLKAKEIGMNNTIFYNTSGLPMYSNSKSYQNTTTAKDMIKLEDYVYTKFGDKVVEYTSEKTFIDLNKGINHDNTNPLVGVIDNVDGLKTGFTDDAGYCLAFSMKVAPMNTTASKSNRLLGVILGTNSKNERYQSSYDILNYFITNYENRVVIKKDKVVKDVKINGLNFLETNLICKKDVSVFVKKGESIKEKIEYKIVDNISGDTVLANYVVLDKEDNVLVKAPLVAKKEFKEFSKWEQIQIAFTGVLNHVFNNDVKKINKPIYQLKK